MQKFHSPNEGTCQGENAIAILKWRDLGEPPELFPVGRTLEETRQIEKLLVRLFEKHYAAVARKVAA
jgi:hypothetical protein